MNTCFKWLKAFLVPKVRKKGTLIAPISYIYIEFPDFSFFDVLGLNKFLTILLALPPTLITSLSLALNIFGVNISNNPVIFNIKVSSAAILLKFQIKY